MKWLSGRAVSVRMLVFCIGVLCLGAAGVSRAQDNLSISPEPLTYIFQAPGPLVVTNWMSRTGSTNVDVLVTAASSNNAIVMVTPVNILAGSASNTIVFLIFGTGTTHIGASAPGYNATNWLVRVVGVSPSITVTPTNLLMNVGGVYTARLVRVDATNNMINPVTVELRSADTSIFQVASAYTNLVLPGVAGNVQTNDVVLSGTGVGVTNLIVSAAGYATDSNTVVTVLGAATQVHSYAVDPFPIPVTGGGTAVVTITRTAFPVGSLTNDVTFTLTSSATNVFGVLPASVVMLGTNTASQSGSVVLSGFISGTGTLGIVSSDPLKYPATNVAVSVTSGVWQITYTPAPLNVYTGRTVDLGITRFGVTSNALSHSVTAYLASADAARFTVLPTVAVFTATSGLSQSVTGLAVRGVSGGTAQLRVTYSDSRYASTNLAVNVMTVAGLRMPPAMVVFTNEARVFDVVRAGDTNVPLVVNLAAGLASGFKIMGDSSVYSYSDVLTIPAGQASAAFRVRGESIAIVNILVATVPSLGLTTTGSVFVVTQVGDSDADNLPDWWELLYFTNLAQNASGDYDNDGLNNLTELRCYPSTDPTDSDTDHNGVSDYDEDFDDDWLTNGQEQDQGDTRPDRKDTDDDGYTDLDEMLYESDTDPLDSFSPYSVKALRFSSSGVGMVTVSGSVDGQETAAYGVSEFVVECWVKPAVLPGAGVTNYLVTKYAQIGNRTNVNYQLGLRDGGKPFVRYQYGPTVAQAYVGVGAPDVLKVGRWTHLAGQYLDGRLTIYVDGQNKASLTSQLVPPAGKGKLIFGGMGSDGKGFAGDMKEVRVWRGDRTAEEIAGNMDRNLFYDPQSVDPGVLQVVGGESHLRENATTTNSAGVSVDHLTEWTLDCWLQIDPASGPGILMGRLNTSPPIQDDTDMNYYLKLDGAGRLVGGFASDWTRRVIESQPGLVSTNFDSVMLDGGSNELRGALGVQDGKWHHVAYVRNGRETLIYVDGQLDSKQPNLIAPPDYSVTVAGGLGGTLGTISYHFTNGQVRMRSGPMLVGYGVLAKMDEVRVWNRGLTQREIQNQMKANLSGNEDGLVSYFNFDYQQGTLANERAAIRNTSEEYGLYVQGAARVFGSVTPGDSSAVFTLYPFKVLSGLALLGYFAGDDGGSSVEDFIYQLDWDHAGVLNNFVSFVPVSGSDSPIRSDSDGDGLPDWWESMNGLDPRLATGAREGANGDLDNDGLCNYAEYLSGTRPNRVDSDGDGVLDDAEDGDSDGLSNRAEWNPPYGSDPGNRDTDDDGVSDGNEVRQSSRATDSLSFYTYKALKFAGLPVANTVTVKDEVDGDETARLSVPEWTIEALVWPQAVVAGRVSLLERVVARTGLRNFSLGLTNGIPCVSFDYALSGSSRYIAGTRAVSTNGWTHLAARYSGGELSLFVGGVKVNSMTVSDPCAIGAGDLTIGGPGFSGYVKEVRVWKIGRSNDSIDRFRDRTLFFDPTAAQAGYLRLNGTGYLKEISTVTVGGKRVDSLDEWTLEAWIRTTQSGQLIARRNAGSVDDVNYYMSIDGGGRLVAGFSIQYDVFELNPDTGTLAYNRTELDNTINNMSGDVRVNDGRWHHVAYVRDASNCYLYVDGLLESKQDRFLTRLLPNGFTAGEELRDLAGPVAIGAGFTGDMDEIRIWNRGLGLPELRDYMSRNLLGREYGLVSYFNLDYQRTATAYDKSTMRNPDSEYGLFIDGARLVADVTDGPPIKLDPSRVYSGVAIVGYYPADDGGTSLEDFTHRMGTLPYDGGKYSGRLTNGVTFVDLTNSTLSPYAWDSDGDSLPDTWEVENGFDPGSGGGTNGWYADPDEDGLVNLYEYYAGTDPRRADTDSDGISDYDDTRNNGSRSWGELYDDGDRIPDRWEVLYSGIAPTTGKRGLDPHFFDADLDPDEDGWSNYAEYMGYYVSSTEVVRSSNPLDPRNYPQPQVSIRVRYSGKLGPSIEPLLANSKVMLFFYRTPAMDGFPDAIAELSVAVTNTRVFADGHLREGANYVLGFLDVDGDEIWDTASEPGGLAQSQPVMIGWEDAHQDVNYIEIGLTDGLPGYPRFAWEPLTGAEGYTIKYMLGTSLLFNRWVSVRNGVHEGDYLHALKNQPGSGLTTYGLAPGTYNCQIYTNMVFFGKVVSSNGYHGVEIIMVGAAGVSVPGSLTGHDAVLPYARNEITCGIDANATWAALEIGTNSSLTPVLAAVTNACVFRDPNGYVRFTLPFYAGDSLYTGSASEPIRKWANGRYWVRIVADNPGPEAPVTTNIAINLDLQPPATGGKSMVSGKVLYFGKVAHGYVDPAAGVGAAAQASNLNIIVQSYMSEGFCGNPDAQVEVVYSCTNSGSYEGMWWEKGSYQLMGLHRGVHYVRAFIDLNGNRMLDRFEPVGFARNVLGGTDYEPRSLDLSGDGSLSMRVVDIVIRDRDTDDDQLPDGWEWMYFGTLTKGAYDYVTKRTLDAELQGTNYLQKFGTNYSFLAEGNWYGLTNVVYTGSSLQFFTNLSSAAGATVTLLWNYEIEPVDVDPTRDDYDGDGLGDIFEVTYSDIVAGRPGNLGSYDPYDPVTNPNGKDLNPARVDTDGDGLSDGFEIKFGFDPINPNGDRDGDGVSDADELMRVLTNPQERQDALGVLSVGVPARGSGAFNVQWLGKPGVTYCVQYSVDLLSWTDAVGGARVGAGLHSFVDLEGRGSRRYYRIVVK